MAENKSCYEICNETYPVMNPARLFCKKGCDSEQPKRAACRQETCNKLCIKSNQGEQRIWFKFLLRAPEDPSACLEACMYGCNNIKDIEE